MQLLLEKLPTIRVATCIQIILLSIVLFAVASVLKPSQHYARNGVNLERDVPKEIGEWFEGQQSIIQVSLFSGGANLLNQIYDDMLMRMYEDKQGNKLMLALAYAKEQRQDVKIHLPEVCYPAQGYQLLKSETKQFNALGNGYAALGKQQLYYQQGRLEAVTYWVRVGDQTLTSGKDMRLKIIKDGLLNQMLDDGILVRVSSVVADDKQAEQAYALHEKFLAALVLSVGEKSPGLLLAK